MHDSAAAEEYVPELHCVHAMSPGLGLNKPGSQAEQAVGSVNVYPLAHLHADATALALGDH